jgi:hypothetical protein
MMTVRGSVAVKIIVGATHCVFVPENTMLPVLNVPSNAPFAGLITVVE